MAPQKGLFHHPKRPPLPALVLGLALVVVLVGMSVWGLLQGLKLLGQGSLHPAPRPSPTMTMPPPTPTATVVPPVAPVSPLLFGTNLSLFDTHDQVLLSAPARARLRQMHLQIIRMPVRSNFPRAIHVQAAQAIKSIGAAPLVVLRGAVDPNVLVDNIQIITIMNSVFGKSIVYYEYGNEEDLLGISVERYTMSWNSVIPQLKHVALNGHFIGPVNFQFDPKYLASFLQHAQPLPDEVSWHEYTCDDAWSANMCIDHISNWTTHIVNARTIMQNTIGGERPIMITEWNYAPNAVLNDGKNNDPHFMATWTTTALQTLAANRIFASMQYSCTGTAIPLVNTNDVLTAQGSVFQEQYQRMIVARQMPAPIATSIIPPDTSASPVPTPALDGTPDISFEDGDTAGWNMHGQSITGLQNNGSIALDGIHSLQVTLDSLHAGNFPYLLLDAANAVSFPEPGQTLSAYIYLPSNSVSLNAKVFVVDSNFAWHSDQMTPLIPGMWNRLTYALPAILNGQPRQIGIQFSSTTNSNITVDVYIDAISWR